VKGGDYRSREANVYRLAELSNNIIDQCVAQGVPFAREYGGMLDNRSFGGAQVSRTFYARGQTGQQLLLGAYQALSRQIHAGTVTMYPRHEMLDLVVVDGYARGITVRDMRTGEIESHVGDAVILCSGGYSNVYYLSTNAKGCNVTAAWRSYKKGAFFANPCYTQIHPTCIPVAGEHQSKLTLMSESLRNDGRIWVPRRKDDNRPPNDIPDGERWYYLEERYPSFGNLVPRDIASRAAKNVVDEGHGVGPLKNGVYLDFKSAIARLGERVIRERYGNLFDMYENITGENPYKVPMRIYPALHYTMGGLWVDYELMSTIPGLFVLGEANFSDHGANRLGASALMQGLADGYFVAPATLGNYLASTKLGKVDQNHAAFKDSIAATNERIKKLLSINGTRTVDSFHRELGHIMWNYCGMERTAEGLRIALEKIPALRQEFWENVRVTGEAEDLNQSLERAGRVADFLEMGELICIDALNRNESCGGHFRAEYQTPDGEALRDDENYAYVAAWQYSGNDDAPLLHKEPLTFDYVHLSQRSYK
jgi:succinate dehydrogenase / fumarate reductase flavoprotein subunit